MSRKRSSMNNLFWGILGSVITSVVAIIIPRLFIVNYGSEVNGFLASIRQIYVYLALLEVGVGDASVVALYGPIGKRQYTAVNHILAATDRYYKRIGIIYAGCIGALGLFYPLLLDTSLPYTVCCMVIILQGSGSVINYLVQGKYNMLLRVDNKNYITTNLGTITTVLTDITRIALLINGKNIVEVQAAYLFFNLLKMLFIRLYIRKNYQWLDLSVKPDYESIAQRGSVFMHQISSLIFSHTDVLILTFVCGLKTVSFYSMYATVYGMVDTFINIASGSVQSALGQIFHIDKERYMEINEAFETYYLALVFSLFAITSIFILPFMSLYTNGADINYIDWKMPLLFGFYQLLSYGRVPSNLVIGFAGEFKSTQWRAWLETMINLTVSFLCVFKYGVYGVLAGTIAGVLYRANDMIFFANHRILKRSALQTYRKWGINAVLFLTVILIFRQIPMRLDSYFRLILHALWVSVFVIGLFFTADSIIEKKSRKVAKEYLRAFLTGNRMVNNFWRKQSERNN